MDAGAQALQRVESHVLALTQILHDHLRSPVSPRHSLPVGVAPQLARSSPRALVN